MPPRVRLASYRRPPFCPSVNRAVLTAALLRAEEAPLEIPTPAYPLSSDTPVINPTFAWLSTLVDATYDLEVSTSPTFATLVDSVSGISTTEYKFDPVIPDDDAYYWRVRAHQSGVTSAWAQASFTLADLTPVILTGALPDGLTNVPYNVSVLCEYCTAVEITAGSLPTGLAFSSYTDEFGKQGRILGSLASAAEIAITITATGDYGTVEAMYAFDVDWRSFEDYMLAEAAAGFAELFYTFEQASGPAINRGSTGTVDNLTVTGSVTRQVDGPLGAGTAIELPGLTTAYLSKNPVTTTVFPTWTVVLLYNPQTQGASSAGELFVGLSSAVQHNGTDLAIRANYAGGLSTTNIPNHMNNWHLLFFTFDNEGERKLKFYFASGGIVALASGTPTAASSAMSDGGILRLGYRYDGSYNAFGVFNKILTLPEMQILNDLAFGEAAAETYYAAESAVDGFDPDTDLTVTQRTYYDQMWTAIEDPVGIARVEATATYQPTGNPYSYALGRTLGMWYVCQYGAFARTHEEAHLTEICRIMNLITIEDIPVPGDSDYSTLNETGMLATLAMHAYVLDANKTYKSGMYAADATYWKDALVNRINTLHGGAVPQDDLAHTFTAGMFTAFVMYRLTGDSAHLARARQNRQTWIDDLAIYAALKPSPTDRTMQFHRMPYAASTGERYWQPGHYARYTFMYIWMMYKFGFIVNDMNDLAKTQAYMFKEDGTEWYYVCGDSSGGVDLSGTGHPALTNETPRAIDSTFSIYVEYDETGLLAPRLAAAQALDPYYYRNPNIPAGMLSSTST